MTNWPDDNVILYDGVCVFCSRWVRFVATRDVNRKFRFTAIQSPYGTRLAQAVGIDPADPDTNAVIHGGAVWFKSDAALTVLSQLPGWQWMMVLFAVPRRGGLDRAALQAGFAAALARYKHPRAIVEVDALPRTALGKIDVGTLRGLARELQD